MLCGVGVGTMLMLLVAVTGALPDDAIAVLSRPNGTLPKP